MSAHTRRCGLLRFARNDTDGPPHRLTPCAWSPQARNAETAMRFRLPNTPEHQPSEGVISVAGIMFAAFERDNPGAWGVPGCFFIGSIRWLRQQEGTVRG